MEVPHELLAKRQIQLCRISCGLSSRRHSLKAQTYQLLTWR
jgi:hypothetical protein